MEKKYYIWKDPACGGKNIEWLRLTGREFFSMLKQPENKSRRFIRLGNDITPEADVIIMEATEEQFKDWKKEQNAHSYLKRINAAWQKVSLDCLPDEIEGGKLHDVTPDPRVDVAHDALANIFADTPKHYFGQLEEDEYQFLTDLYVMGKSMVQMASERGVTQQAISGRAKRLINRLKKYF